MSRVRIENAEKSRRNAAGSTGVDRVPSDKRIYTLRVRGSSESRIDDRRDVRGWRNGICGVANHCGKRRQFPYIVTLCNIFDEHLVVVRGRDRGGESGRRGELGRGRRVFEAGSAQPPAGFRNEPGRIALDSLAPI